MDGRVDREGTGVLEASHGFRTCRLSLNWGGGGYTWPLKPGLPKSQFNPATRTRRAKCP